MALEVRKPDDIRAVGRELAAHQVRRGRRLCLNGLRPAFLAPGDALQVQIESDRPTRS